LIGFGVGDAKSAARRHGEVFLGARRRWQEAGGRVAKFSSARVGEGEGAEANDLQPGELFGACRHGRRRWGARSAVRRRGDVFLGACRHEQGAVACRSIAQRCGDVSSAGVFVGKDAESCSSINFGRPGAQLGSSVAFGLGCGQAPAGVPRKASLCSYHSLG